MAALNPALVFIGFMGAGKSRAAREAAAALGGAADDADALLEAKLGEPIEAVFADGVAEHQVGRNRPKEILVDAERIHVDELEAVPLCEPARLFELGAALSVADRADVWIRVQM